MSGRLLLLVALALASGFTDCSSGSDENNAGTDAGQSDAEDAGADIPAADEPAPPADDGGIDEDGDAGNEDEGDTDDPWSWCPSSSEYHGDDWDWTLRATETAVYCVYCATSAVSDTLPFELQRKSELRIVPGEYPLPSSAGDYDFRLPICLNFTEPGIQPVLSDPGTLNVSQMTHNNVRYLNFILEQPLRTETGVDWVFKLRLTKSAELGGDTLLLDGSFPDLDGDLSVALSICESPCEFGNDTREFSSCHFDGVQGERHRLVFEGGRVDLHLRISPGYSMAGQLPALFVLADGELDGEAVLQEDYWKLAFTGGVQHYLNRHFLFLFDAPVGTACGLKAEDLDVMISDPPARLTTIDCDLNEIEERPISEESWE